jgi:hypothetical protein
MIATGRIDETVSTLLINENKKYKFFSIPIDKNASENLIGKISKNVSFSDSLLENNQLNRFIKSTCSQFISQSFDLPLDSVNKDYQFNISEAWFNYQYAGDFQPLHIHPTCDLVCVIYLETNEHILYEHTLSEINNSRPGGVTTFLSLGAPKNNYIIDNTMYKYNGMPGEYVIFPADLPHMVYPFESPGCRITASLNIKFR